MEVLGARTSIPQLKDGVHERWLCKLRARMLGSALKGQHHKLTTFRPCLRVAVLLLMPVAAVLVHGL